MSAAWPAAPATDPAGARDCADLAARFVALDQVLLDEIGDRTVADYRLLADAPPAWLREINATFERFAPRGAALGCAVEDVERRICVGAEDLEASGPAGEDLLDRLEANLCDHPT